MNLIEQLDGYEKAKIRLGSCDITLAYYQELDRQLLEYRRQHNIFEVGDWIVMDSHKPEYQFYQITKDDMGSHWINLVEFRHATDEEIKAGKRLEVNQ
ncbi:hypothetical protein [Acinetobacter sp. YH12063]|uniref:hypothetical protein n=1 Tax=Acinetobacter sp. YH12063 TaxID=2601061 RepID=UPI0015D255E5|nr:hypothetical protein [Acinetobacter sp. YH12063]